MSPHVHLLVGFFALMLAWSAAAKWTTRRLFAAQLVAFGFGRASRPLARVVPLAEGAVAIALVVDPLRWIAACALAALLGAFTVFVASMLARGRRLACWCFGDDDEVLAGSTLARNAVLLAACAALVAGAWHERPTPWNERLQATCLGGALFLASYAAWRLRALVPRIRSLA